MILKVLFNIMLVLMCGSLVANADTTAEEDWTYLFNGKDLSGWVRVNGSASFEVDNGTILGQTVEGSPNSFLCTIKHYSDFVLEFEVKVDPRLNSGVQIRSNSFDEYRNGRVHGYQVEIAADGSPGFIYDEARRGWLSPEERRNDPKRQNAFKDGEWNQYTVLCAGDRIMTWINNVEITNLEDDMTKCGFIGLQVHSFGGEHPAWVRWRNIRIKQLNPDKPCYDVPFLSLPPMKEDPDMKLLPGQTEDEDGEDSEGNGEN